MLVGILRLNLRTVFSDGEQRYRVQGTCWKLCKKSVAGYGTEPASLKSVCQHSSHLKFHVFSARYQRIKF